MAVVEGGGAAEKPRLEIGILTKGKPTLAMVLSSLLLQEEQNIAIHIVDTSEQPVVRNEDFSSALRLAFDRNVPCTYEHSRDRSRPFSSGRHLLLEALPGPHVCFMDDDVVVPGGWLRELTALMNLHPDYGFLAPVIKHAVAKVSKQGSGVQFTPGSLFRQDELLRRILLDYYANTVDVLDRQRTQKRVREIAFLTELFALLQRPGIIQPNSMIYHLDYRETPNWDLRNQDLVNDSRDKAAELVQKYTGTTPTRSPIEVPAPH